MKRILLVEDDTEVRHLLRLTLERGDYFVREASNGLEALAALQSEKFDAVVLDIAMPKIDGLSLLSTMKVLLSEKPLPVLIVSANNEPELMRLAKESGASDYLVKPFEPQKLLDTLAQHFATS